MLAVKPMVDRLSSPPTGNVQQCDRIAAAIDSIGQPQFVSAVAALCQSASGYTSTFISAFFRDQHPVELFDNLGVDASSVTIGPYLAFAYLLDPFYNLFRRGVADCIVPLSECAPDDFRESDYYRTFYSGTGLFDETSVFVNFGNDACLVISLGSRDAGFQLGPEGRNALEALLPVVSALCRRHWPRLDPATIIGRGRMGHHLEKSFERFGTSVLSEREAEIVRLILKGHSSKSVARLLGNSPETVKVHRKRIHAKLNVASQGELFSIFLEALSHTPPNATEDPLSYLGRDISPRPAY